MGKRSGIDEQIKALCESLKKEQTKTGGKQPIGYRLYMMRSGACYPTKGKGYYDLDPFEWPLGAPMGRAYLQFVDPSGKALPMSPPPQVRILAFGTPDDSSDEDSESDDADDNSDDNHDDQEAKAETKGDKAQAGEQSIDDSDPEQQTAKQKRANMRELDDLLIDESLGELLSESKAIKRKRERAKLSRHLGHVEQLTHYYELFDHMKTDMTRQLLTVSKVNKRTTDIQLQLIDKLEESLAKATHAQVVEKENGWAIVGTEALRTIADLGKTAMSSRAMLLADARPVAALPAKDETKSEALKEATEAKEIAKRTESLAQRTESLVHEMMALLKRHVPADTETKGGREEARPVEPPAQRAERPHVAQSSGTEKTTQATEKTEKDDPPRDPPPTGATGNPSSSAHSVPRESSANTSKHVALAKHPDPFVQSWRSIKRFIRWMSDADLMVFCSSVPMFRGLLSMLRAMTPYYKGPSVSLEQLAGAMPFGGSIALGGMLGAMP